MSRRAALSIDEQRRSRPASPVRTASTAKSLADRFQLGDELEGRLDRQLHLLGPLAGGLTGLVDVLVHALQEAVESGEQTLVLGPEMAWKSSTESPA